MTHERKFRKVGVKKSEDGKYDEVTYVDEKGNYIVLRYKGEGFWKKFAQATAERQKELRRERFRQLIETYCKFCRMKTPHEVLESDIPKKRCMGCGLISLLT